jgi:hypothetical protein
MCDRAQSNTPTAHREWIIHNYELLSKSPPTFFISLSRLSQLSRHLTQINQPPWKIKIKYFPKKLFVVEKIKLNVGNGIDLHNQFGFFLLISSRPLKNKKLFLKLPLFLSFKNFIGIRKKGGSNNYLRFVVVVVVCSSVILSSVCVCPVTGKIAQRFPTTQILFLFLYIYFFYLDGVLVFLL